MIIVRNKILILLIMFFCGTCAFGQLADAKFDQEKIDALANEAMELFQQGSEVSQTDPQTSFELYSQSILWYRKIIDEGNVKNSAIYYNIGNAYLMQKNIGYAILNYRRALKYGKATAGIDGNLHYARALRLDNIPEKTQHQIMKTLFFWHYDFAGKVKFYIAIVSWALFWGLLLLAMKFKRKSKLAIILTGLVCIAFAASTTIDYDAAANDVYGVIVADTAIARWGDGDNYAESFDKPLHGGTEFLLLETRGKWIHVELVSGDRTWLKASDVEEI